MSKALKIACMLEKSCGGEQHVLDLYKDRVHIAAEFRRLHELNAELVAVCERVSNLGASPSDIAIMNRLIAKAKEQA